MENISRRAIVAGAACGAVPRLGAAKTDFSADERKKALLDWAREDALAEEAAGNVGRASAVRADIAASGSGDFQKPPAHAFIPIPRAENSPSLADALKRVKSFRDSLVRYPKGEAGNIVHSDAEGWRSYQYFDTGAGTCIGPMPSRKPHCRGSTMRTLLVWCAIGAVPLSKRGRDSH